jgi:hypothetical protein
MWMTRGFWGLLSGEVGTDGAGDDEHYREHGSDYRCWKALVLL